MTRISIHIDKLVLPRNMDAGDVTRALRKALEREVRQNGRTVETMRQMPSQTHLDAGRVDAASGADGLGRAVSQAIIRQHPAKRRSTT
ncbi:MAG: hypothetical protein AAF999_13780 [Pseudomonadota bacterium]